MGQTCTADGGTASCAGPGRSIASASCSTRNETAPRPTPQLLPPGDGLADGQDGAGIASGADDAQPVRPDRPPEAPSHLQRRPGDRHPQAAGDLDHVVTDRNAVGKGFGAEKPRHRRIRRASKDGVHRTRLDDGAPLQKDQLVRQEERFLRIMGDENCRRRDFVLQRPQLLPQLGAEWRIQRGEGLVQEQQAGRPAEGAGDGDALLLAEGKLVGRAPFQAYKAQAPEPEGRLGRVMIDREAQLPRRRQMRKEAVALRHIRDAAGVRWHGRQVPPVEEQPGRQAHDRHRRSRAA